MGERAHAMSDPAEGFANARQVCILARINGYQLLRLAAIGEIKTQRNAYGRALYNLDDARRFSGKSALA